MSNPTLSRSDHAIWSAMGLGPVWVERATALAATQVSDSVLWLGDFDTDVDAQGHVMPIGPAGQLLLNMLQAVGLSGADLTNASEALRRATPVFSGVRFSAHGATAPDAGFAPRAGVSESRPLTDATWLREQVQQRILASCCGRIVVMGAAMASALGVPMGASPMTSLTLQGRTLSVTVLDGLSELLAQPARKAEAWRTLCQFRRALEDAT